MSQNPIPQGKYKPAVRHGGLIFTAGMTPVSYTHLTLPTKA